MRPFLLASLACVLTATHTIGSEPLLVWPGYAPGETTKETGTVQPFRPNENPPITRVTHISQPTFTVHLAEKPNGSAAIILPGGGFAKVVPDKEGTEAADWLNRHGVSAFVLSYRPPSGTRLFPDGAKHFKTPSEPSPSSVAKPIAGNSTRTKSASSRFPPADKSARGCCATAASLPMRRSMRSIRFRTARILPFWFIPGTSMTRKTTN